MSIEWSGRNIVLAVFGAVIAMSLITRAADQLTGHRPLPSGQIAPPLKGTSIAGENIDLDTLRDRPVLVDFFATWCQPCIQVAPVIAAIAAKHPNDLRVIGVALDGPETAPALPEFIAKHGMIWPVIDEPNEFHSDMVKAWKVRGIPALFLIAADGTLVASDLDEAGVDKLEETIERLLANLAVRNESQSATAASVSPFFSSSSSPSPSPSPSSFSSTSATVVP